MEMAGSQQNLLESKGPVDVLTSSVDVKGSPREVAARQIISSSLDQALVCKVIVRLLKKFGNVSEVSMRTKPRSLSQILLVR